MRSLIWCSLPSQEESWTSLCWSIHCEDASKRSLFPTLQNGIAYDEVYQWFDGFTFIEISLICMLIGKDLITSFWIFTEDVDVFTSNQFSDFRVGSIHLVPSVNAPFNMNFMLPVPWSFFRSKRDLLRDITSWDQVACSSCCSFSTITTCKCGAGSCLQSLLSSKGSRWMISFVKWCRQELLHHQREQWLDEQGCFQLDVQVFVDYIQSVHLLTFVFVKTFDLGHQR